MASNKPLALRSQAIILIFLILTVSASSWAQTTRSTATTWSTASSWNPSTVPGPNSTANVTFPITINQNISINNGNYTFSANATDLSGGTAYTLTMSGGTMTINSGSTVTFEGSATISGTLTVKSGGTLILGATTFGNNTNIVVEAGGTLIINGNLVDSNNGNGTMVVNGYVQVNGNYSATSGGVQVTGTGTFQTTGSITTQGGSTMFGSTNDCTTGPCSGAALACGYINQITPSSQTVCTGQTASVISSFNNVPAGTSVSYQWQWSSTQGGGTWTTITGATSSTLDPNTTVDATLTTRLNSRLDTYFRVRLTVAGCPTTPENYSPSAAILFRSFTPPSVTLPTTLFTTCAATATTLSVPYTVTSGSVTRYSLSWSPTSSSLPTVNSQVIPASPIQVQVASTITSGTYTGTFTFLDANSCTPGTKTITLIVGNATPGLSAASAQAVCGTGVAQATPLTYTATNSPATYNISWNAAALAAGFTNVTSAPLSASPLSITVPAGVTAGGIYTGTMTVSNGCGTSAGQNFNVTVNEQPTITLGSVAAQCFSEAAQSTTMSYTATSGAPVNYSITWDATAQGAGFTNVTSGLVTSPILVNIPAAAGDATYSGTVTVSNANCTSVSNAVSLTIHPRPLVTSTTTAAICSEAPLNIALTASVPSSFSWQAVDNVNTTGESVVGQTTSSIADVVVSTSLNPETVSYSIIPTSSAGCVGNGQGLTVTVNPKPVISGINSVNLCNNATTNIELSTNLSSAINWTASPSSINVTGAADGSGSIIAQQLSNAGNAAETVTYNAIAIADAGGCASNAKVVVATINPTLTLSSTLNPAAICSGNNFTYTPTTVIQNAALSWQRLASADIVEPVTSGTGTILESLTSTATETMVNAQYLVSVGLNGCSADFTVMVPVAPSATLVWNGSVDSDWLNASNWTCSQIPTASYSVVIPSGTPNAPVIASTAVARNVTVTSPAVLTLLDGSTLYLHGNLNNNGTFVTNRGIVELNGANNQTINGRGAQFYQINIDKTGGSVTIGTGFQLVLRHLLQVNSATTLNTNNLLVLASTDATTANDAGIGPLPAGASISGNVTVRRWITAAGLVNRYISSPVNIGGTLPVSQLSDDFRVGTGSIRVYSEPVTGAIGNGYVNVSTTGSLASGRGYLAYMYENRSLEWDATGAIANVNNLPGGVLQLPLTYTPSSPALPDADGWNLLGNPFASSIAWGATGWQMDPAKIETTVFVTDLSKATGYPNYYRIYNYADGSGDLTDGIIATGQAFWVHALTTDATIAITENAKTSSGNGRFYRSSATPSQQLKISINNGIMEDNAFLKLNASATTSLDVYDARKLMNPEMNISLVAADGKRLAMNAISQIGENDQYYLSIDVVSGGEFTLSIRDDEGFAQNHGLFFIDSEKGVALPVNGVSDYRFSLNESTSTRFYLSRTVSAVAGPETLVQVYPNPSAGILTIQQPAGTEALVEFYDLRGRCVYTARINGSQVVNIQELPSGMYLLKHTSGRSVRTIKVDKR